MRIFFLFLFGSMISAASAQVQHPPIGRTSVPDDAEVELTLISRIQNLSQKTTDDLEFYEPDIISPKSAMFLEEKGKFYVNSLEGCQTVVFDLKSFEKITTIPHKFTDKDAGLFKENTVLGYEFLTKRDEPNTFEGKPVECCFSHNKKYLWVTYYRRSYDPNAMEPSAVAIIDTDKDQIVRVMPTGPLPKMIACSPDNKYIAVTHWGDNTIGIIDISSGDVNQFKYVKHLVVDYQQKFSAGQNQGGINRDTECGLCLRGTAFTADSRYLVVGRMGGGGISVFDMKDFSFKSTVLGMRTNVRHLIVTKNYLYLSSNKSGYVQKAPINDFINFAVTNTDKNKTYDDWQECFAGAGARTIEVSDDEKYIFAACNNASAVVVIRAKDMKKVAEIQADSFPVGLALRKNNYLLISTSQAHPGVGGGNCVDIYFVRYNTK